MQGPEQAAQFLTVVADKRRFLILILLSRCEMTVGALAGRVHLSATAASQHLAKLRKNNLVETRRDGREVYYSCRSQAVIALLRTLDGLFGDELPATSLQGV